jgi:hypothetical protein
MPDNRADMDSKLSPWLPVIAAVAGVSTFAATVFAYLDGSGAEAERLEATRQ